MININEFDEVFDFDPQYAYPKQLYSDILSARRRAGTLFFDRLLTNLNVQAQDLYPPQGNRDLRRLHRAIIEAPIADHHKQSLLFYIVKDCRALAETRTAEDFARECGLPDKYWTCVDGLWQMDKRKWRPAVECLTHPSIIPPVFPEEVLSALLNSCKQDDARLPMAYYNTVQPQLNSPELLGNYFKYLARYSITEAFYFLRKQPEYEQTALLGLLIETALSADNFIGEDRAKAGMELVELPFTEEEEATFDSYLLKGAGKGLPNAKDTVMMRKIATGRFQEALQIGKQLKGKKLDDVNWESIKDAIKTSMGPRKDVYAALQ